MVAGALVVAGVGAAWGFWSFSRINRVDLELAQAETSEPRNFLVVGSDSREDISEDDPDAGGMLGEGAPAGQRADSLMVARVDPGAQRIDLLSVPRDLWVPISPSGKKQRINTAYSTSAQAVVDTVQDALDIPIHHFVEVDFRGFQSLVDALGGVPMYFENPVRDRNSGLAVRERGCRVLDGYQGLAFARARHLEWSDGVEWHSDPTGDLGRATRQQLLTRAALSRAHDLGLNDIGRVRKLVDAAVGSVTLDGKLGAGDLMSLAGQLSDMPPDRMQTHALPVTEHTTDGGAAVVLIDEQPAQPVLQIFRGDVSAAPVTTTPVPPPSPQEVTVDVYNGSGTDGEARRVSYVLSDGGFEPGAVESAAEQAHTTIAYPPGAVAMAELTARWLTPSAELVEDDSLPEATGRVTLGGDFAHVAEPGSEPEQTEEGSSISAPAAPESGDGTTAAEPPATTTTQPGWTPGVAPAGVTCNG